MPAAASHWRQRVSLACPWRAGLRRIRSCAQPILSRAAVAADAKALRIAMLLIVAYQGARPSLHAHPAAAAGDAEAACPGQCVYAGLKAVIVVYGLPIYCLKLKCVPGGREISVHEFLATNCQRNVPLHPPCTSIVHGVSPPCPLRRRQFDRHGLATRLAFCCPPLSLTTVPSWHFHTRDSDLPLQLVRTSFSMDSIAPWSSGTGMAIIIGVSRQLLDTGQCFGLAGEGMSMEAA